MNEVGYVVDCYGFQSLPDPLPPFEPVCPHTTIAKCDQARNESEKKDETCPHVSAALS